MSHVMRGYRAINFLMYNIMPLSQRIYVDNLKPGKKYLIEVQWNLTNNLRMLNTTVLTGTFVDYVYVRGRTRSFDSGLQLLLSRSRFELVFNIDGKKHHISSVNKFYEILTPSSAELASVYSIYRLPLPNDLKKEINYFIGNRKKLYYRRSSSCADLQMNNPRLGRYFEKQANRISNPNSL
jgi:hypothetical protein